MEIIEIKIVEECPMCHHKKGIERNVKDKKWSCWSCGNSFVKNEILKEKEIK